MMEQRPVQTIDSALLDELLRLARLSSRRRAIFCLHDGAWMFFYFSPCLLVPTSPCPTLPVSVALWLCG